VVFGEESQRKAGIKGPAVSQVRNGVLDYVDFDRPTASKLFEYRIAVEHGPSISLLRDIHAATDVLEARVVP
jgi:hypothetical protein